VHPTLLAGLGLALPSGLDGESQLRREVSSARGLYAESFAGFFNYGWSPLSAWAAPEGIALLSSHPRVQDPGARQPRAAGAADEPLLAAARRAIGALAARPALEADPPLVAPERLERLRALGYAAAPLGTAEPPHPLDTGDRPCPLEHVAEHVRTLRAVELSAAGRAEEALPLLAELLAANPSNRVALEALANAALALGRWTEAADALERLLLLDPERLLTYTNLAHASEAAGRRERAIEVLLAAVQRDPSHRPALTALVRLLDEAGRGAEARQWAELLLEPGAR
jgi:tetratricopeptide (TPR) repeat protein